MSYDSLVNRGDYLSAHYLAEVLPKTLRGKNGLWRTWDEREKAERERVRGEKGRPEPVTPRGKLRALKGQYFKDRPVFAGYLDDLREGGHVRADEAADYRNRLHTLHRAVLDALGYAVKDVDDEPQHLSVASGDALVEVRVAHQEPTLVAIECGWAPDTDAAMDEAQAGKLLDPVERRTDRIEVGTKLAQWLFTTHEQLRYVLILAGGVVILADTAQWGEGRYLAANLDTALGRGDTDELGTIAALFGAEMLLPPEEGGAEGLSALKDESRQHAVGVSSELREGLRDSVEIIANEVLARLREQGVRPSSIPDPPRGAEDTPTDFPGELAREALRYLYRILFLLYAEARPELGVVPADDESYMRGYSMARLGDLVVRDLVGEESRTSFHLYESLDLLFQMVNRGHRPRGAASAEGASEGEGLRFEALRADLFNPERTRLIGRDKIVHPDYDPDDPSAPCLDTRLRNETLYTVLRLLMLARGRKKQRGGFISYAQLGINQLGAVYEGLMSYTGFIAEEELYEAAKNGDPTDGSWLVPASAVDDYPNDVWVYVRDEDGKKTQERVRYRPGAFVYRLAGRDRETSASYYTPESLTSTTVQLTLRERLKSDPPARELLDWTICEPALGSGAFLNEAINQVAAEYLRRRHREVEQAGELDRYAPLTPENYTEKLQAVKAYIALHNCYGVDLNTTAVELAEVSLWLNVMHRGMRAPWFGLHLRRGNSLVGARRCGYPVTALEKSAWLKRTPEDMDASPSELKSAIAAVDEAAKRVAAAADGIHKLRRKRVREAEKARQPDKEQFLRNSAESLDGIDAALGRAAMAVETLSPHLAELRTSASTKPAAEKLEQTVAAVKHGPADVSAALHMVDAEAGKLKERLPGVPEARAACQQALAAVEDVANAEWLQWELYDWPTTEAEFPAGYIHQFLLPAHGWGAVASEKEAEELAPEDRKKLANWRKQMRKAPSTKRTHGQKRSQVQRLQALARRVEFLWSAVTKRLELSEWEISRRIDVWGADDLRYPEDAVPREKVLADLQRVGTPYWRLKTLMDAWCALWFWPVQEAGLLDGSDEEYRPTPVSVQVGDPDDESPSEVVSRTANPLTDLDAWLTFAEALVGTEDVPEASLFHELDSLAEIGEREGQLPRLMGMVDELELGERFPWLHTVEEIAQRHGFFHWELQFAQVFRKGGFDLQMGNPPWVRPTWKEDTVLAEKDPWFGLAEKIPVEVKRERKEEVLKKAETRNFFLIELAETAGMSGYLSDATIYPLMAGTQPDLYRAFMCRVWRNITERGNAGLIHPDTHLGGVKDGELRAAAYRHLRFHAFFVNGGNWAFPRPVGDTKEFGMHIYGAGKTIEFTSINWLYSAYVILGSLKDDGSGEIPSIKYDGKWDLRPHKQRMVHIDENLLIEWRRLTDLTEFPVDQTPMLYPVTTAESGPISALAEYRHRIGMDQPYISAGYHEKMAKEKGFIRWETSQAESLDATILQGPHFIQATPFAQLPKVPCKSTNDWYTWNLPELPENAVPVTNYKQACETEIYRSQQDVWDGYRDAEYFRLAWRRQISFNTERSLFAALILPGPTYVFTVHSLAFPDNLTTSLNSGFWAGLPIDYLLRITGRSDLTPADARRMPAPDPEHPLARPLLLRTLRLNCLTNAYAPLWSELFSAGWREESWAVDWPGLAPIGAVSRDWEYETPLRTERERRAALVELDVLVAVWLGIGAEQLVDLYSSRYPVLAERERDMWFDVNGNKIAGNHNTYGYGQTKEHYLQLQKHLEAPDTEPPPDGYTPPFYKAEREEEYRQAHAVFSERVRRARESGEWDGSV